MPTFGDPALVRRNYVFFEHTAQALTKLDPDSALNGDELDRIPSYVAVRSRTGLLIRYDMDTDVRRNAWAYEFYSYKNRRLGEDERLRPAAARRRGAGAAGQARAVGPVRRASRRPGGPPVPDAASEADPVRPVTSGRDASPTATAGRDR